MSERFEPHASWLKLRERAAATADPRHKKLLSEVADHMEAEIKGELEPLMATLTAAPVYHFWRPGAETMVLEGSEAVRGFYSMMFENHGQQFQVVLDRIFVSDEGVVTEGQVRQVYASAALATMGVSEVDGAPVSSHAFWMSDTQLVTVWPADPDAKLVGEDIYFGEEAMATLTPIAKDEIPEYFIF